MQTCIEVRNLKKRYGSSEAVQDISFHVKKAEIFAFLGPNGAGKSTTISILSTLMQQDSGDVIIEGFHRPQDDAHIRSILGIVFQGSMLDESISVKANLLLRSGLYGLYGQAAKKRVQEIISLCSLEDFVHQNVNQLSGGQRRKADIARALIPNPKLLILDEPSTGLDPKARQELWKRIVTLKQQCQMTIFMTTHYMEEANIADHICMIHKGKIILDGTREQLQKNFLKERVLLYSKSPKSFVRVLEQKHVQFECFNEYIAVIIHSFFELMSILRASEMYVYHVELVKSSIEDVYLELLKEDTSCESS